MEDFTFINIDCPPTRRRQYWDEPEDKIILSPEKMYLRSLATNEKLPERLHEAMIVWSFDSSSSFYCKLYLDWVSHLEKMQSYREKMNKRFQFQERIIFASMVVCFIILVMTLTVQRFLNG